MEEGRDMRCIKNEMGEGGERREEGSEVIGERRMTARLGSSSTQL